MWSPQLGAQEKHVAAATSLVPDPRARHFWDPGMLAGTAFQPLAGSSAPAWDTWLLFDRTVMWRDGTVPQPAWWEHQLSSGPPDLMLDADRWAAHAFALTDTAPAGH